MTVIRSAQAVDCRVETGGRIVTDDEMHQLRPTTAPASQPATQPK
jgi:hypothetical protein